MISVEHRIPRDDMLLGIVRAEGLRSHQYPPGFDDRLRELLARRSEGLDAEEEGRRAAARDMLRNGKYKPTGRGKPANEYLLRAAVEPDYAFPRINAPVDICNYLSLLHIIPISLWDLDLSNANKYVFRLGQSGERYVFNTAGQEIELEDLVIGCRVQPGTHPTEDPIVSPVKDSLATKTNDDTTRVAACVYAPAAAVSASDLDRICGDFLDLLCACGESVEGGYSVLAPGSTIES